ncbi:FeoA family protein [Sulfurospirillum deleyianum]|uniref:FeoA family protein n=1 Tax=Sulfurospirillum deleyianum (strain ATCC 51133 / DSM 6946 / 5175) TaxID=525898 RepID=D1B3A0_SULD5|nr:ferrous iron transport protein A [Sulfurospirillum deleyianum]ACZ12570.1 FeoA family protein [Sulfurospirillum deleyianum DSM 6946]NCB82727.1 ferrous iron transport protein A [Bacilli bacterium]
MHLGELRKGQKCRLVNIHGAGKLKQKLLDMGFIFGADIEVVREAPLYDPMELRIQNYLVSLRRNEATLLEVKVL